MHPQLNLVSALAMIAATITLIVISQSSGQGFLPYYLLGTGGVYGAALGWSWVASAARSPWIRVTIRAAIVVCFAYVLLAASKESRSWLRFATQLGGIILSQSVLFHVFRVPNWRTNFVEQESVDAEPDTMPKFSILDVMLITSAYGVLLSLARLYVPPTSQAEYWPVTMALCVYFPILAMVTAKSSRTERNRHALFRLLTLILLMGFGNFGLTWIQIRQSEDVSTMFWQFYFFYLLFIIGFVVAVGFFSLAGVISRFFPNKRSPNGH